MVTSNGSPDTPETAHPLSWCVVTDIDNTLLGEQEASLAARNLLLAERARLRAEGAHLYWVINTGRTFESACEVLIDQGFELADFDAQLTSVGAELYLRDSNSPCPLHQSYLARDGFQRTVVEATLCALTELSLQPELEQRPHKVGYFADEGLLPRVADSLRSLPFPTLMVHSHSKYLDVAPAHGAKGGGVDYLLKAWGIPRSRVVTAGDSGNDRNMLDRDHAAIVVGNGHGALADLRKNANVVFAERKYAEGVVEGLRTLGFLGP